MINLTIFLIFLLSLNAIITLCFDTKFGKSLPLAFITVILIAWVSELFFVLSLFKYIAIIISIINLIYIYIYLKKKENLSSFINNYFNSSFFVFLIFAFYLYFVTRNLYFNNIDDYYYWGVWVRQSNELGAIYPLVKQNLLNNLIITNFKVPPFVIILATSFSKFYNIYKESYSIYILGLFSYSFLVFLFDDIKLKLKNLIHIFVLFILTLLICLSVQVNPSMIYESLVFNSLYIDWILSFHLIYSIYFIIKHNFSKTSEYIIVFLVATSLMMVKNIGLALAILVLGTLLFKLVVKKKNILVFIILLIFPAFIFLSWKVKTNITHKHIENISEKVQYKTSKIPSKTYLDNKRNIIFKNFYEAINGSKPILIKPINLSYNQIIFITTLCIFLVGYLKKSKSHKIISLFYFLGAYCYAFVIYFSYFKFFPESESFNLTMFGRYMQTYTFFGVSLTILCLVSYKNYIKNIILCLVMLFLVEPRSLKTLKIKSIDYNYKYKERYHLENFITNFYNDEKILVINTNDLRYSVLIQYIFGNKVSNISYFYGNKEEDAEKLEHMISLNECVLIGEYNNDFKKNFWDKKYNDIPLYNSTLYRVIKTNDGIKLEFVFVWENKEIE